MARAKVVAFDYFQFLNLYRRATDSGKRIDPNDAGWAPYIKDHAINEVAATVIARQKFDDIVPVVLAEGQDTDGLYFFSRQEEACLRLVTIG
jgi:hypothetical protein